MKFLGPSMFGVTAALCTYISTFWPGLIGIVLLLVALLLWLLFIVYIIRAVKPE